MTRSPSVRYCHILTFSENRLLVPAFSSTADGQRGTPRRPSADGVTRLPSPLPYVFHLQGIAPKLLTHRRHGNSWHWGGGPRGVPTGDAHSGPPGLGSLVRAPLRPPWLHGSRCAPVGTPPGPRYGHDPGLSPGHGSGPAGLRGLVCRPLRRPWP